MNLGKIAKNTVFWGTMAGLAVLNYNCAGRDILYYLTVQRPHLEYLFEADTIQGDSVSFEIERGLYDGELSNILKVKRQDETSLEYEDCFNNDLEVDMLSISGVAGLSFYGRFSGTDRETMKEIQKQFDSYLEKIKQRRLEQTLNSLH